MRMIIGRSLTVLNSSRTMRAPGGVTTTRARKSKMSMATARVFLQGRSLDVWLPKTRSTSRKTTFM